MRIVVQRVLQAEVTVDNETVGKISKGLLALIGFDASDTQKEMEYMLDKLIHLRVFEDQDGKMNLSVSQVAGEILVVPNFTLYGDVRKGKRPSFSSGAPPDMAKTLYSQFVAAAKILYLADKLAFGIFQADMKVLLVNDGPVTILIDSAKHF